MSPITQGQSESYGHAQSIVPMRIYLIRHGETEWNTSGRWQGVLPVPLNDTGREQAMKLGLYLASMGITLDTFYSSNLPRAYETAAIIASAFGKIPKADRRWRELNTGSFQGLTQHEIEVRFPDVLAQFLADPLEYIIPGGESRRQLQDRAYAAWTDLTNISGGQQLGIVSHGGTIKMLLSRLFGTLLEFEQETIPNTSITILERAIHGWQLAAFAQTPHLTGSGTPRSGNYF